MDIRKLQRAIVDGLEDVKAQHIVVFNTEALSPLFERVIIATGTSNRQTRALATSVRDAVKATGEPPPRMEGEESGEWIIVDCGAAVVHIMQPAIREYYRLEELWGEKPVALRRAGPTKKAAAPAKGAVPAKKSTPARKTAAAATPRPAAKAAPAKRAAPAKKAVADKPASTGEAAKAAKAAKTARKAAPAKASRKAAPRKTAAAG